jgi:hypothetical protein
MATNYEVLEFLRPDGGYVQIGEEYEGIQFTHCEPFTKEEYLAAFKECDLWKAKNKTEQQAKRQALLNKLGITEEEARLLLGGN